MSAPFLQSPLLASISGIKHAFSTRDGGVSEAPYNSLNLGGDGDARSNISSNRQSLLEAVDAADAQWISLRQVHGANVVQVTDQAGPNIESDAVWTKQPGVAVAVLVADCVPILVATKDAQRVAAIHAGWRGTQAKIGAELVSRWQKDGIETNDLVIGIGPAIGPCCFSVGDECETALRTAYPSCESAFERRGESWHVDLWALNQFCLTEAGVPAEAIDCLRLCTQCRPELFSHRGDKGSTGRQAGVILRG